MTDDKAIEAVKQTIIDCAELYVQYERSPDCCGYAIIENPEQLAKATIEAATPHILAGQWRDIESAPRDGTRILLRYYKGNTPDPIRTRACYDYYITEGYFEIYEYNGAENWMDYAGRLIQKVNGKSKNNEVTHWMPIPNPPQTPSAETKGE